MTPLRLAALVALLAAGCAAPRTGYADRVEVGNAEIVVFFLEDAFDDDVEATLAALQERVTDVEEMQIQWRDTEEVELDPALLPSAFGSDVSEAETVGEAILIDLSADFADDWLVETGDILARQRGVQTVTIGNPTRRVDPLCYWGEETDMVAWLTGLDSESAIDDLRFDDLAGFSVETLERPDAYQQMLVLFEFQPELSSILSVETMPMGLLVDVGVDPGHDELLAIRDDLESLAIISSILLRPPSTVRTVCP